MNDLKELIESGMKSTELAEYYSVSTKTVQRRATQIGLSEKLTNNARTWHSRRNLQSALNALEKLGPTISLEALADEMAMPSKNAAAYIRQAVNEKGASWRGVCEHCHASMCRFYGEGRFCNVQCARGYASSLVTEAGKKLRGEKWNSPQAQAKSRATALARGTAIEQLVLSEEQIFRRRASLKKAANRPENRARLSRQGKARFANPEERANASFRAKIAIAKVITENRHVGWKTRPLISYPESVWMKILEKVGIEYKHNFPISRKELDGKASYFFLDFALVNSAGKLLDFEVDGKQHTYPERLAHDAERDCLLKAAGWQVFRVPWVPAKVGNSEVIEKLLSQASEVFSEFFGREIQL